MSMNAYYGKQVEDILYFLMNHDHYLITAHINADGDAIASAIAMGHLLKELGKYSIMVFHDRKVDPRFNYLQGYEHILSYQNDVESKNQIHSAIIENAIVLDAPGYGRLGDVSNLLPDKEHILKIDHHPVEDIMGPLDWVDEEASSTTVLVYEVIAKSGISINQDLAECIFTGIIYDTGRFSFSNTTARDLYVCSKMVEIGVKPSEIANRIFFQNSFNALKTIGKGLHSLENHLHGAVNIIYLGYADMAQNDQSEIEELANYSVAIRGGKVGLFIREVEPGLHKVSFRSHSHVDVNRVAKNFDGGGHSRAAGCRIRGSKNEIIDQILQVIKEQL